MGLRSQEKGVRVRLGLGVPSRLANGLVDFSGVYSIVERVPK